MASCMLFVRLTPTMCTLVCILDLSGRRERREKKKCLKTKYGVFVFDLDVGEFWNERGCEDMNPGPDRMIV